MPNRILFNEQTKILLAEKFINVQFLVPFPKYNLTILDDYTILSKKLNSYWTQPSLFCDLDFSTGFNSNDSFFIVDWLLNQVKQETNKAKLEVELHAETKEFLNPDQLPQNRQRRGAPIAALAVASIGLFGIEILVGNSESGLRGIFGSCQEKAKENAENIMRLADISEAVATDLHRLRSNTNEKLFFLSKKNSPN